MNKYYCLDSNVLLHNPLSFYDFAGNTVIIPLPVIEEIDNFKSKQNTLGRNARIFSREMNSLIDEGDLSKGVYLEDKDIEIKVESKSFDINIPEHLNGNKIDNKILALVENYRQKFDEEVILVSKDINLRIKGHSLGLKVEDYKTDTVDYSNLYKGYKEIENIRPQLIDDFYKNDEISISEIDDEEVFPNKCYNLSSTSQTSALGIYKDKHRKVKPINRDRNNYAWGINPLNREQEFAMQLLLDDSVKLVSLVGKAGTGKTLLSMAVGLEKVIEQDIYDKFVVLRPIVPMGGNDLGYLPGDKQEKLSAWMKPIRDNLDFLMSGRTDDTTQHYLEQYIDMEALTYIRGRSIPNQFILMDEAQNISSDEVKTLLTRIGEGTKVVLTGDPEQIDDPYLDSNSNGLTYAVEKMKNSKLTGSVLLTKGERSPLAEEASNKL